MSEARLAIDVGNTETAVGLFRGSQLIHHWRLATELQKTPDELALQLRQFVAQTGVEPPLRGIIGSVVPPLDAILSQAFRRAFGCEPRLIDTPGKLLNGSAELPIRLDVDEPASVGSDRLVNTLAARCLYGVNTIAVDLGTATTFDCITGDGRFLGGAIAPGPRAGIEGLARRASKLPFVDLARPDRTIGRRTDACLRSGCFYAIVDSIDGMVRRIKEEWEQGEPLVVATGGLAALIGPHCRTVDLVDPYLTLYGLEIADRLLADAGDR